MVDLQIEITQTSGHRLEHLGRIQGDLDLEHARHTEHIGVGAVLECRRRSARELHRGRTEADRDVDRQVQELGLLVEIVGEVAHGQLRIDERDRSERVGLGRAHRGRDEFTGRRIEATRT